MEAPAYTAEERRARETFHALLHALSQPGQPQTLPAATDAHTALAHIGATLLDLETTYYTPDAPLAETLRATGARHLDAAEAAYHFYPQWDDTAQAGIAAAPRGDMLYPERAATLVLALPLEGGPAQQWDGPGIDGTLRTHLAAPEAFWLLREQAVFYPLGWDVVFVSANPAGAGQVLGLPRTTHVAFA